MCLTVSNWNRFSFENFVENKYLTAKEDIVCYKVLKIGKVWKLIHFFNRKLGEWVDAYMTPYQQVPVSEKIINGKKKFKADMSERDFLEKVKIKFYGGKPMDVHIDEGLIHTVRNLKTAEEMADTHLNLVIFECIIPKGTKYMKGTFTGVPAYASRSIKFVKEIEKEDVYCNKLIG